jgi:hypothetical protein
MNKTTPTYCHPNAYALRAVHIDEQGGDFVHYEAITFPENPTWGCEFYLKQLEARGFLCNDWIYAVDVLDKRFSILQTYTISREGHAYLREKLCFRKISHEHQPARD